MSIAGNTELSLMSLARIRQLKTALEESSVNERNAREGGVELSVEAQLKFLTERVELYNEKAMLGGDLLHSGAQKPSDEEMQRILELSEELDLAERLRVDRAAEGELRGCWPMCTDCISDCTQCVTDCGLAGSNFGSDCIGGTLISACRPSPGF